MQYSAQSGQSGFSLKSALLFLIMIGIIGGGIAYWFGSVVYPGQMGVRQISFGPYQGFSRRGLEPGYHWSVPFYSQIHFIPSTLQVMHLHRDRAMYPDSLGALEVQTTDGSSVYVDISVLYRFYTEPSEDHDEPGDHDGPGDHGGPYELTTVVGTDRDAWQNRIHTAAVNELKKTLGRLSTAEFYNPDMRERRVLAAKDGMNKRLRRFGIHVEGVLLRRYTYAEQRIDQAIFQKNLQDQEERLNAAKSRLAEARARTEQVGARWDARIKTLLVEGENKAEVIRSKADLYEAKARAEGDLAIAKASAEVDRQRAGVLAQSEGVEVFVAKELAPLLGSLKGGVVTGVDPYDLQEWMNRFGFEGGAR